jgi:hypothetical protein
MSMSEDLERLAKLLDEGKLTQEEYDQAKKSLLEKPTPQPRPAATFRPDLPQQAEAAATKSQNRRIGCLLIIVLVVGAWLAAECGGGGNGGSDPVDTDPVDTDGDTIGAYVVCQQFVEEELRAPATAEFGGPYSEVTEDLGSGRYRVTTYVDAENAFGAMIRTDFECVVSHVSGDQYRLESLDIE